MLATPVEVELLVPHESYKKGTRLLAIGGMGQMFARVDEMPRIEAQLLCVDEAGGFVWVPVVFAKVVQQTPVVAAQAGAPLRPGGTS